MKRMAIISSYSESCGNASFTKIIHDSVEMYNTDCDVDVIELDLSLLQSKNPKVRKLGDQHINEICHKMADYDVVNIQFEAGLFGALQKDIVRRTSKIIKSHKNVTVTMHSPRLVSAPAQKVNKVSALKKILRGDFAQGYAELRNRLVEAHVKTNMAVIECAISNKCKFIVHTLRAKRQIKNFFGYTNVVVHPLVMVPDGTQTSSDFIDGVKKAFHFEENDVLIGMFGYISEYKGHSDAIKAIKNLPKNYKLLIFGRQHPQTIRANSKDAYLQNIISEVKSLTDEQTRIYKIRSEDEQGNKIIETKKEVTRQVYFMGEISDEELLSVAGSVDVCWLPYYENGQDGSGIASICLDVSARVLCSNSFAFDQLFKLKPYNNVMRFDIGNDLEIVEKTHLILEKAIPDAPYGDTSTYNIQSQAMMYSS